MTFGNGINLEEYFGSFPNRTLCQESDFPLWRTYIRAYAIHNSEHIRKLHDCFCITNQMHAIFGYIGSEQKENYLNNTAFRQATSKSQIESQTATGKGLSTITNNQSLYTQISMM
jgi:hypothetical protein